MKKLDKETILAHLAAIKPTLRKKGVVSIALFGSFAKDTPTVYSDIDIAIKKEKDFLNRFGPYDYFDLIESLKSELINNFHRPVDIFDLDSVSSMKEEIEKE